MSNHSELDTTSNNITDSQQSIELNLISRLEKIFFSSKYAKNKKIIYPINLTQDEIKEFEKITMFRPNYNMLDKCVIDDLIKLIKNYDQDVYSNAILYWKNKIVQQNQFKKFILNELKECKCCINFVSLSNNNIKSKNIENDLELNMDPELFNSDIQDEKIEVFDEELQKLQKDSEEDRNNCVCNCHIQFNFNNGGESFNELINSSRSLLLDLQNNKNDDQIGILFL